MLKVKYKTRKRIVGIRAYHGKKILTISDITIIKD